RKEPNAREKQGPRIEQVYELGKIHTSPHSEIICVDREIGTSMLYVHRVSADSKWRFSNCQNSAAAVAAQAAARPDAICQTRTLAAPGANGTVPLGPATGRGRR